MSQRVTLNGVDLSDHVVSAEITVKPCDDPPFSLEPDFSIGGELSKELTADEWAELTEHFVVSEEPGEL